MRSVLSALLFVHGLVHTVGFIGPLGVIPQAPFQTRVFGRAVPNASPVARSLAVLWLLLALAFSTASVALFAHASWWFPFTVSVVLCSSALCVSALPASRVGLAVNAGVLLACTLIVRAQLWADLVALLRVLPL